MNVLIVDDDRFVVTALKTTLHWDHLGFQNVYTAYNIQEAKKILENEQVHLLLSDIGMPNGSGLDLLAWMRECHNHIPAIFLTNYADFNYAKRALELKTFYYFLKPIEYDKLEAIILEATQEFRKRSKMNSKSFWQAFIRKTISIDSSDYQEFWELSKEVYTPNDYFLPIVFDLCPYSLDCNNTLNTPFFDEEAQIAYITTTFHAAFSDLQGSIASFFIYNTELSRYVAVLHCNTAEISSALLMNCDTFINLVDQQMHCSLNCFIGVFSSLEDFQNHFSDLCSMVQDKIDVSKQIIRFDAYTPPISEFETFDSQLLEVQLNNKDYDLFFEYCSMYLKKLSRTNTLSSLSMASFQIDVLNVLYSYLKSKEILPNKLFQSDSYHVLSHVACRSVEEMKLYLQYVIQTTKDFLESSNSEQSVAEILKKYVDQHYAEDIHTSDIADVFFIDSDYGSKLFKKQFGISFKNYIIQKRIDTSKQLLLHTDLSINAVSINVGYENYSYFTRLFKKLEGITPTEYRIKHENIKN